VAASDDPRVEDPYLLCYDGSREAAHAIQEAGKLIGGREALVVNAWSPPSAFFLEGRFIDEETSPLAPAAEEFDSAAAEDADRIAREGTDLARAAGFEATGFTERAKGAVWHTIVRVADERDVRAIVVGSQAMSRFQRAILGSSAQAIVANSDRPVIVVPFPREQA
jgi:nucleotide-binding universal stress UspA family protein